MTLLEILVIIFCALIVIGVIIKSIRDKKSGKGSCGCCCKNCALKGKCNTENTEKI